MNAAIDMAGSERGNMRCWEALGCGSLMISDAGTYPPGMTDDATLRLFSTPQSAVQVIEDVLSNEPRRARIAAAGHEMISRVYSKQRQWTDFQALCGAMS